MPSKSQKQRSTISTSSENSPWFWLIAGPNGVGKSTWANLPANRKMIGEIPVLNPDHFIEPYVTSPLSPLAAGKRVFREVHHFVAKQKSFAVETTLSGNHYFRLAEKLKTNGWAMGAVFIGVRDEDSV